MDIRGNICIQDRFTGKVYLYTHKKGLDTFGILKDALKRGEKVWRDEQYLARVIFCELIKDTDLNDISDFGISTFLGDNDLPIFIVDIVNGRVLLEEGRCLATCPCVGCAWTIDDFLTLKEDPRIEILKRSLKDAKAKRNT